jgi:hypothetical protein
MLPPRVRSLLLYPRHHGVGYVESVNRLPVFRLPLTLDERAKLGEPVGNTNCLRVFAEPLLDFATPLTLELIIDVGHDLAPAVIARRAHESTPLSDELLAIRLFRLTAFCWSSQCRSCLRAVVVYLCVDAEDLPKHQDIFEDNVIR